MKAGEVKVLMYENVLLIDIVTAVMHYASTGHTNVMTGGVCFGLCVEWEREEMERSRR